MKKNKKKIIEYWDSRAVNKNKKLSGSNDELAHKFETNFMNNLIGNKVNNIFDLGCGNGSFLKDLSKTKKFKRIAGIDTSKNMISECKKQNLKNSNFFVGDIEKISNFESLGKFDCITSKRCLINLLSTKRQILVINKIGKFLKKSGSYFACECSSDALKNINLFRKKVGLDAIKSPWHNCYINDGVLKETKFKNLKLIKIHNFTSTYYFVSRVVNALVCKKKKVDPKNSDLISRVAWNLDQSLRPDFSQVKVYEFKKL
jgi:SAM-dependent methyltransferase